MSNSRNIRNRKMPSARLLDVARRTAAIVGVATLSACSITTTIKPPQGVSVQELCIIENPDVLMNGFLPELQSQVEARGVRTQLVKPPKPDSCKIHLEYTANWRWDMAMYLSYAVLAVFENDQLLGEAVYDARYGGGRPDKFGTTGGKLRTLTEALFIVQPGSVPPGAITAPDSATR